MHTTIKRLTAIASGLAFFVVMLGAFTRLTDAGLGCPDWPGCYGHYAVPHSIDHTLYPGQSLVEIKAWTEMIHRYLAGTLGLMIVSIAVLAFRKQMLPKKGPIFLVTLLIFQALLGMWTVTLKLHPTIVMLHLIGGFTTLSVLWSLFFREAVLNNTSMTHPQRQEKQHYRWFALIGLIILIMQIALGGWTSANYAAIVCPDFPFCNGHLVPALQLKKAFSLFQPVGPNFAGGIFDYGIRVTIHMMHRFGALLTTIILGTLNIYIISKTENRLLKISAGVILLLLSTQVTLGILNVVKFLPLPIAVLHNGVAALLLLATLSLNLILHRE